MDHHPLRLTGLRALAAATAAILMAAVLSVPASAATELLERRLPDAIAGVAEHGIPPRPAALRPRTTPVAAPPQANGTAPAPEDALADTDASERPSAGPPALPADAVVAQVSGEQTGDVVVIPAPQPAVVEQSTGLVGVVQLGPNSVTMEDVARHALNAGFVGEDLVRAVAVAYAESTNDPSAIGNNRDGSRDYGLWQINSVHSPPVPEILNPATNAIWAYRIWAQRDRTWFPWYAFYNPHTGQRKSDAFMADARIAVNRVLAGGAIPTTPAPGAAPGAPPAPEAPNPVAQALNGEACRASWMGEDIAGAPTASGAPFDPAAFTAAMYTVPLGSVWTITNADTGASIEVVINDRGPDRSTGRCIDLSAAAFSAIAGADVGTVDITLAPA